MSNQRIMKTNSSRFLEQTEAIIKNRDFSEENHFKNSQIKSATQLASSFQPLNKQIQEDLLNSQNGFRPIEFIDFSDIGYLIQGGELKESRIENDIEQVWRQLKFPASSKILNPSWLNDLNTDEDESQTDFQECSNNKYNQQHRQKTQEVSDMLYSQNQEIKQQDISSYHESKSHFEQSEGNKSIQENEHHSSETQQLEKIDSIEGKAIEAKTLEQKESGNEQTLIQFKKGGDLKLKQNNQNEIQNKEISEWGINCNKTSVSDVNENKKILDNISSSHAKDKLQDSKEDNFEQQQQSQKQKAPKKNQNKRKFSSREDSFLSEEKIEIVEDRKNLSKRQQKQEEGLKLNRYQAQKLKIENIKQQYSQVLLDWDQLNKEKLIYDLYAIDGKKKRKGEIDVIVLPSYSKDEIPSKFEPQKLETNSILNVELITSKTNQISNQAAKVVISSKEQTQAEKQKKLEKRKEELFNMAVMSVGLPDDEELQNRQKEFRSNEFIRNKYIPEYKRTIVSSNIQAIIPELMPIEMAKKTWVLKSLDQTLVFSNTLEYKALQNFIENNKLGTHHPQEVFQILKQNNYDLGSAYQYCIHFADLLQMQGKSIVEHYTRQKAIISNRKQEQSKYE